MTFQIVILVGNLGNEPTSRFFNEKQVTNFNLATNQKYTNAAGERKEETVWFRVSTWGKLAENVNQYCHKGKSVLVIGKMQEAKPWTGSDGEQRFNLEVKASEVIFLGSANGNGNGNGNASEEYANLPPEVAQQVGKAMAQAVGAAATVETPW